MTRERILLMFDINNTHMWQMSIVIAVVMPWSNCPSNLPYRLCVRMSVFLLLKYDPRMFGITFTCAYGCFKCNQIMTNYRCFQHIFCAFILFHFWINRYSTLIIILSFPIHFPRFHHFHIQSKAIPVVINFLLIRSTNTR